MQIVRKVKSKEFQAGDKVRINNMFYRNHGLKIMNMQGIFKGEVPSWESKTPLVRIALKYNPIVNQWQSNGLLKYNVSKEDGEFIMLVRLHPMYVEKVK